jgi:hypothetical protein
MNKNDILIFASVVMLFSGCASIPTKDIKIDAKADPKANFGGYKSYAWLGSAAIVSDIYGQWEPPEFDADAEIKFLIDRELRKRGMLQSSTDPDLIVAFAAGINMDALGLKKNPDSDTLNLVNVPRGGLVIVLVDAKSGFAIWAGTATANFQKQLDTKTARARLDYAVTHILQKLPE